MKSPTRRSLLGIALGGGAAAVLAACGAGASPAGGGPRTLKWGWALPTSWDPVTSSAGWDVHALSLVYAGLTKEDPKGDPVPALAERWTYAPDGTSVDFTLRPGLTFSDGSALDAAAVRASLLRGRDDPKSLVASQLVNVAAVTAPDARTVRIALKQPDFQVPALLAGKTGMVVNPGAFTAHAAGLATRPAGAGPFALESYTQNAKAVLRRNRGYWDAAHIELDAFELYPLPDPSTVVAALSSGQYDVAQIPGSQVKAAEAAGLEVQVIPSLVVSVLDVNVEQAPFTDPDVALALKYAIDRGALLETAAFGYGEVTEQPFPKGYVAHDDALDGLYPYDPDRARQLLAGAGHAGGLELTLTTADAQGVPEILQAQLKEVGITVRIEVVPEAEATQIVYLQHDRALFDDQFAGRDSAVQAFQVLFGSQGLMNPGRTDDRALDAALEAVRRTPLESPHYPQVLRRATSIAVRTMPNVFLYTVPRILARNPRVSAIPEYTAVQRFEGVTVA
jgi:peptide/nickel transport system substrate-binding protein